MDSLQKLISGGQTGADRAALDVALRYGFPHGGWCPKVRKAEDGPIGVQYQLKETPSGSYPTGLRLGGAFIVRIIRKSD